MTWLDAQMYCREHHTDLASIRSLAENEKIRTLKPAGLYVWFGLYKDAWKWSDGPLFIYQHWKYAPSGRLKKCAAADFGSSGFWTDWQCDQKKAFICHHDPVPFSKHSVKVKLVKDSSLDLNDPAALQNVMMKLDQKLKEQGVTADIKLSWKKQRDGNVFFKDEEDQK
ncbi:lectin-like [Kryptolebias marmoratus]|uniref:lectin-like n=2 Tax=Kryptolebias marmoratus TaxID=37003 RepID=UPI0018ACD00F|nr:lectin-like [Kryptolebias marmoratus]